MPESDRSAELALGRAALAVEAELRQQFGAPAERLDGAKLSACYPTRRFTRGWRIDVAFSDGKTRSIDLLVGPNFPTIYPRTALVDRPDHMTWPHVEHDGVLCLLPIMAEVDAQNPGHVAINLLARSARLVEELLEGKIVDRDFREEFLTYWFYNSDPDAPRVESLVKPEPPSRIIRAWRDRKGNVVVADDDESLQSWLTNRKSGDANCSIFKTTRAAFLWLPQPPLPSQYPLNGAHIVELAQDQSDIEVLIEAAAAIPDDLLVLVAAEGRGGAGLIAMTTTSARKSRSRTGMVEKPLTKGFREAELPPLIAVERTFSTAPVLKSNVKRADPAWIHGRSKDPRSQLLLERTCTLIGCGSIGSTLAVLLARAGTGRIRLVDPENLDWSNVSRHELGAQSVGLNKAEQLANRLKADFPHLDIRGFALSAHSVIENLPEFLLESDLVLVATGSWQVDGELNRWHIDQGRTVPILYGWAESHAAAGHAVVVAREGGCLRCGVGPTGVPIFQATQWPDGATQEEPACGNHFQPAGAIELSFVSNMIANAALQVLLSRPSESQHHLWLSSGARLKDNGGKWTESAQSLLGDARHGFIAERPWPATVCGACRATALRDTADLGRRQNAAG